jgi:two-component system sensor histidine kinase KdpD
MVCLSSRGPNSEALLRYASRLAGRLNRNWYALYVQTSRERPTVIDAVTQRMLSKTLTLAQQLGATVFTYKGDDIVKTILQFAREYRVGHIVLGTPGKKVPFWRRLRGAVSVVEGLITQGRNITVVVLDTKAISNDRSVKLKAPADQGVRPRGKKEKTRIPESTAALLRMTALVWEALIEKEEAIRRLFNSCRGVGKRLRASAWESVLEREQQGGTFVGEDVAIPHARIVGLSRPIVAIGVGRAGIQDHESGRKVRIMVLLLSPVDPPESHLELLGLISRMARDDQWRKDILAAGKSAEIMRAIQKWEAGQRISDET